MSMVSSFQSRHGNPLDKISLRQKEDYDNRQQHHDGSGHLIRPVDGVQRVKHCDAGFHRAHVVAVGDDQRPEEIFPRIHESKDGERRQCRFGERQNNFNVTIAGIIIVAKYSAKILSRPLKRSLANAYAASEQVMSWPSTEPTETISVFKKNLS